MVEIVRTVCTLIHFPAIAILNVVSTTSPGPVVVESQAQVDKPLLLRVDRQVRELDLGRRNTRRLFQIRIRSLIAEVNLPVTIILPRRCATLSLSKAGQSTLPGK